MRELRRRTHHIILLGDKSWRVELGVLISHGQSTAHPVRLRERGTSSTYMCGRRLECFFSVLPECWRLTAEATGPHILARGEDRHHLEGDPFGDATRAGRG